MSPVWLLHASRINGKACDHHICNYSSELENSFKRNDVGSAEAGIDLQAIIEAVQEGKSQFGKSRQAQAEYRRKAFDAIRNNACKGKVGFGNTFMRKQLIRGPESTAEIADFTYGLPQGLRVPTPEEHFVQNQIPHEPLPIYRLNIVVNCEYDDLTDDEYYKLLELYRSPLMPKKQSMRDSFEQPMTRRTTKRTRTPSISSIF